MRSGRIVAVLVTSLLATAAWGGNLTAVRVGVHADYTRLVFQLDGATPYQLVGLRPRDDGTQVLVLQMQGLAPELKRVPVRGSPHVKGLRVASPAAGGTELNIRLRGEMELKELVLTGPDRIVLDFFSPGAGRAPAVASLVPPALSPVATATPTAAQPTSEFDQAEPELEEPRPSIEELHAEAFPGEVATDPEMEAAAGPAEELAEDELVAESLEAEVLGAADPPMDELDEPEDGVADAFDGVEIAEVVPDDPAPMEVPSAAPAAETGGSGSLLGSPVVLAAVAGLAIVGLLFVLARRRKVEPESEPLFPFDADAPGPADEAAVSDQEMGEELSGSGDVEEIVDADAPAPFVAPPTEHDIEPEAIVVPEAEVSSTEEPDMGVGQEEPSPVPTPMVAPLAPSELAQGDVAKMVEEFERRIAHLENRLDEVTDAKERLERQVGAQTEELRVQRAAIARTQRVLRTIARPEDEASEPVPKV